MLKKRINFINSSKIIKGKDYSLICDFQKQAIKFIPNLMVSFIDDLMIMDLKELKCLYPKEIYEEYLKFLIKENFVFFSSKKEEFIVLENKFYTPEIINNAVIEYRSGQYDIKNVLKQLDLLLCKFIEIRFIFFNIEEIYDILCSIDEFVLRSIRIYVPFINYKDSCQLYYKLRNLKKLESIVFYGADQFKNTFKYKVFYIKESIKEIRKGNLNNNEIIINLKFYLECLQYNPYYNKKVCIDDQGNIKNCIKNRKIFGNVNKHAIDKIINKKDFQEFWRITHDMILEYKDDPLRYNKIITNDLDKISDSLYKIVL